MNICEVFHSIQGEGTLAGLPSVIVRTAGCNLRCAWCDTPYASWQPEGTRRTVDEVISDVASFGCEHVVVTGGEPMIDPDIGDLTRRLRAAGHHVTLETAATVCADVVCDLASISPKLANSTPLERDDGRHADRHDELRINIDAIRRLMDLGDHQIKFVVEAPGDLIEIDSILADIGPVDPACVLLMPLGTTREDLARRSLWLVEVCKERRFRYCPRVHIEVFGNRRGV